MANADVTTNPRIFNTEFLHASEQVHPDGENDGKEARDLLSMIEESLEEERTRLMLANSILGCMQAALDPEAINVTPPVYFPDVLEQARQLINTSLQRLEYEEIRRALHRRMGGVN